ncbi:MAG: DUF1343 domain-containing protein [Bdellovibrionota bacterium]
MTNLRIGLEVLEDNTAISDNWGRCGLLSNQASVDRHFRPSWQIVSNILGKRLTALFGPQHGFFSTLQDNMIETTHDTHEHTGLPIYSLYSEVREPTEEMLANVDTLIIDLQITGCRVYTWKATIMGCLKAAKKFAKKIVILDRTNPVGGIALEGRVLDPDATSFVGPSPIPMRHGLSAGEAALFFNQDVQAELEVVPLSNWDPTKVWNHYCRHWVMTSPNLPTIDSVHAYPGMVIFEGTNLSEGRGTTLPFQLIGAPYINSSEKFVNRVRELNNGDYTGIYLRPVQFQPIFHKWNGQTCKGLQIHILDPNKTLSFSLALAILRAAIEFGEDKFEWKKPPYEYDYETLPMKLIFGSHSFERHLTNDILHKAFWREGVAAYAEKAQNIVLYPRQFKVYPESEIF